MKVSGDDMKRYRKQYGTLELLRMAATMLEVAKEQQTGEQKWLTDNLTLAIIQDRVKNPT